MKQNAGGRPRHGDAVKSAPIGIRTDPALRARLEEAAQANSRSLTKEIETRLIASFDSDQAISPGDIRDDLRRRILASAEQLRLTPSQEMERRLDHSFHRDDAVGGPATNALLNVFAAIINSAEAKTGKPWWKDEITYATMYHGLLQTLRTNAPIDEEESVLDPKHLRQMRANMRELSQKLELARNAWEDLYKAHPELKARMQAEREHPATAAEVVPVDPDILKEAGRLADEIEAAREVYMNLREEWTELSQPAFETWAAAKEAGQALANEKIQLFRVHPLPGDHPRSKANVSEV